MEFKRVKDYTDEELQELLDHWFYYYGKAVYTIDELKEFYNMVKENPRTVMKTAILLYGENLGPSYFLDGIRGDLSVIKSVSDKAKNMSQSEFNKIEKRFIKEVVTTYNNPKPTEPMTSDKMAESIISALGFVPDADNVAVVDLNEIFGAKKAKLNRERVYEILREVSFNTGEVIDGVPTKPFVMARIIVDDLIFNAERINDYREEILELVNELPWSDEALDIGAFCVDKNGAEWTSEYLDIERLLALAVVCNFAKVSVIDNVPHLSRVKRPRKKLNVKDPSELRCLKNILSDGKDLTRAQIAKLAYDKSSDEAKYLFSLLGYELKFDADDTATFVDKNGKEYSVALKFDVNEIAFINVTTEQPISYHIRLSDITDDNKLLILTSFEVDTLEEKENNEIVGNYVSVEIGNDQDEEDKTYSLQITCGNPNDEEDQMFTFHVSKEQLGIRTESELKRDSGVKRIVFYTDETKAPRIEKTLVLKEQYEEQEAFGVFIGYDEHFGKYKHRVKRISKTDASKEMSMAEDIIDATEANNLALEYFKTARVKQLYNYVLDKISEFLPGVKEHINTNHELAKSFVNLMQGETTKSIEELVSNNSLKEANISREKPKERKLK